MKQTNLLNIVAFLAFIFLPLLSWSADLPEKHPLDQSESRTMVLDNGLRVVMVSDPELDISAASMSVGVGSYVNPEGTQGLAHFLEHMLFLGTEKYPDESEYKAYLNNNGGWSNAYTGGDHTNYHFQVFPDAFEGALDRFSQFFIAPLFTEEFTERELNAVESEFQKNIEDDDWRGQRLFRMHTKADHPENHFSTGNTTTLSDAKREELIDFYQTYYSANQMGLSLVSTQSLDQMEMWVKEYFSAIENKQLDALSYPSQYLDRDNGMQFIRMKAIQDRRELNLYFNTPSIRNDWDAKSAQLVGSIVGYEGKGSLLSHLKEANLATGLGSGIWEGTADYTSMGIEVQLTPEGEAKAEVVLEMIMGYIEMMRQSPYPGYFYDENATMARLAEVYTDKGEGLGRATDLANRALTHPLEVAEKAPNMYLRQDPDFYFAVLDQLRPDNLLAILTAQDVETDTVESIYGTEYSYLEIKDGLYDRLSSAPVMASYKLPQPNPFVPESVELMAERPVLLIDEPGLSLYYGQDREFQRPKVAMSFKVRLPGDSYSAKEAVMLELYEAAVQEYVNELAYDARMADLGYSINAGLEGVQVSLSGYTESAKKLLPYLVDALQDFEIDEARFAATKDRLARGWANARYDNAFMYVRFFTNKASYKDYFSPEEKAAAAEDIDLKAVYKLRDSLYKKGRIESLVYGNVSASEAIEMARSLQRGLRIKPVKIDKLYESQVVELSNAQSPTFKDVLPGNNSVFRKDYMIGMATPENRVAASVLQNLMNAPYYSEMRTRQQLGYVVWSFTFPREDELRLGFVIQSGEYDPVELVSRSDAFVATLPTMLRELPEEAFLQAKAAVKSEIEVKDKTIGEKAGRFFTLAYEHASNWERRQDSLDALEALTLEDVVGFLDQVNDPDQHRFQLVLLFARQFENLATTIEADTDIDAWKANQSFRVPTDL